MGDEQRAMRVRDLGLAVLVFGLLGTVFAAPRFAGAADPMPVQNQALAERAAADFKRADADGDGQLTLAEFVAPRPETNRQDDQRRFLVFDFDASGTLNGEEFRQLSAPTDERGAIPDPMVEIEQAALAKWQAAFNAADKDGAGRLSKQQWPAGQIARELPALADVGFELWDRDHNGQVDQNEGRWLLEVAYGLTRPNGDPLRTTTGRVFSWKYFRMVDKDRDGLLSRDEFVAGHHQGKEKNALIFDALDADKDGSLTAEETWTLLWHDTLAQFFAYDRNGDGYLTTEELLAIAPWGRSIAQRSARAFDDDADGRLSFREFRGTTFANEASDWVQLRNDADKDGPSSWPEFYLEKPPLLIAQSRWFFDRFDLDKDGFLSLAEFEFDVDLSKVPAEIAFAATDLDADGKLVLTEFFSEPKPPETDPSALDRYEMRLAAAENRFLADDRDSSGDLDLAEFTESRRAAVEAARRQEKVLSDRKTMLEGNYYVRKGVLVVNEMVFLAIVWTVVRRTGRKQRAMSNEQ